MDALTIKRHVFVVSYFCTHVSRLLHFDMDDVISFDIKYFFHFYSQKNSTKNNNKCRHLPTINN